MVRGLPSPNPPRSWTSIEIGKSWSFSIVFGCGLWSIRPLLRRAQPGPPGDLLADEPVLGGDAVVRERVLVEEVAELAVELRPLVVADREGAVLDAEGVVEVLAEIVLRELRRPAVEVPAVEQLDPVLPVRIGLRRGRAAPPLPGVQRCRETDEDREGNRLVDVHGVGIIPCPTGERSEPPCPLPDSERSEPP